MRYKKYNSPYSAKEKQKALNLWRTSSTEFVCHRYHCSDRSLRRWKKLYDGTLESLENKSHRPKTPHPNIHTEEEIKNIKDLVRRNPTIGLNELYGKLIVNYGYKRNFVSLYRVLKRIGFYEDKSKKKKPYVPKPYDTPLELGVKWQMDVKVVPRHCYSNELEGERTYFYQYGIIDEASRERFIYPYKEQCGSSTVDFVKRAIKYFGYKPLIIQTDNGAEFTYPRQPNEMVHLFDIFCFQNGIEHKTIRPRTPRHNGKIERSHRNDNERFYRYLKFYSFEDLKKQMQVYLRRSNNIPSRVLTSIDGKQKWLTPKQKRRELIYYNWGVIED